MKKIQYLLILFVLLSSCEKKKVLDRDLPVTISFKENVNLYVADGLSEVVLKIDMINSKYIDSELEIILSDSAGKFLNNTNNYSKKLNSENFNVPFIVSKTPGVYTIEFKIKGNDFIIPKYLELKLSEQKFIKSENITLSASSIPADGQSTISINLEADETVMNSLLVFEIHGKNGGEFQNLSSKIERKIDNENFIETFTVSDIPNDYVIKTYRANSENFYDTIYTPFTLTSISQAGKILSSSYSSISAPFLADGISLVDVVLSISNLDASESKNVEMKVINNTATFAVNGLTSFQATITGNNNFSSILKATQNSADIILELKYDGQTTYLTIPNTKSFPDEVLISPDDFQMVSSISSSLTGKVFVNKLNGLVSEDVSINLKAFQGVAQVGAFSEVFYNTTSGNFVSFTFNNSTELDTLQNLRLEATSLNDNGAVILNDVIITVIAP